MKRIDVVGAVIVRDGLVLCAQRGGDGPLAGTWEFPGGKIEHGELPEAALLREIREELLCEIAVGERVTTTVYEYPFATIVLTTYWASLIGGEPKAVEHALLSWVEAVDLGHMNWAPADVPAVRLVQEELA